MKSLTKFFIELVITYFITWPIAGKLFNESQPISYYLGGFAIGVVVCGIVSALLKWAYATKVADLYFQGEKVGTITEEEE